MHENIGFIFICIDLLDFDSFVKVKFFQIDIIQQSKDDVLPSFNGSNFVKLVATLAFIAINIELDRNH